MAYTLQAIIARSDAMAGLSDDKLSTVPLAQGFALWPIGATAQKHFGIEEFPLINAKTSPAPVEIPAGILQLASRTQRCAYVEARMEIGPGHQAHVYFEKGTPIGGVTVGPDAVNAALRKLGLVVIGKSRLSDLLRRLGLQSGTFIDEFEAAGLGRFRSTEDWLSRSEG